MLLAKRFKTHKGAATKADALNYFARIDGARDRYTLAGFLDGVRNDSEAIWNEEAIKAGRIHWQLEKSRMKS